MNNKLSWQIELFLVVIFSMIICGLVTIVTLALMSLMGV